MKDRQGVTIIIDPQPTGGEHGYRDTELPFSKSGYRPAQETTPEPLREMKRLFEYGVESVVTRAKNFYRQAVFMRDYEDDAPWTGDCSRFFPTYHDLTTRQLRGYFAWRAKLRKGVFQPIATAAAYIYVYELLNGIGAATPEEVLQKLMALEAGYLDPGFGDGKLRANLRRWMLEYAVLHGLPPEKARQAADRDMIEDDLALSALRDPERSSDDEVFSALCRFDGKRTADSPVLTGDPERGKRLFSEAWRAASAFKAQGKDLFTLCFGERQTRRWYPLANAVYYAPPDPGDMDYALDDCRDYRCRGGLWQMVAYEKLHFDRDRMKGFLHETDARLRRYLKTGRYLRQKPEDAWAAPYIDGVIEADGRALLEAARPKLTIDLSGLEQIRRDAAETRDSLLTGEEREECEAVEAAVPQAVDEDGGGLPLDGVQLQILRALLEDRDGSGIIRENHLMPSLVADAVNEALFDEFGDTVVLCEGDRLYLVEDYTEDLGRFLGGKENG